MLLKFIFMLSITMAVPEQTTWVWPEAHTYPEERHVLVAHPVHPVDVVDLQHTKIILPKKKPTIQ